MGQGVVAPKLPTLLRGSSQLELDSGISASLMYLGVFISTFMFGKLADRGRVHWLLGPGLFCYAITLVLLGFAQTLYGNFLLRLFEGLCLSAIFISADFILGKLSAADERGRWLSYYGVAMSFGLLLGPTLALALGKLADSPLLPLCAVAICATILGWVVLPRRVSMTEPVAFARLSLPLAPLATGCAYGFMEAGLVAALPAMASEFFHVQTELCLIVVILSAAAFSFLWGTLSDRSSPKLVVRILVAILVAAPAAFAIGAPAGPAPSLIFLACGLFGMLAGGLYPIAFAWLLESTAEENYGQASGAFARAYGAGSLVGPLASGWASQRWHMTGLFVAMALAGVLAAVFVFRRIR